MMKRISYLLYIVSALAFVSSCSTIDDTPADNAATLTVKIAQQDPKTVVTRSVTETIRNVNILVFNAQGNLIGSAYNDSAPTSVSVPVRTSNGCTVCAIANTGSSSYFDGISTLTELKARTSTAVNDPTAMADIMYGEKPSVDITGSTVAQNITLKRLYSKYTFTITPSSDIAITGYQLCNVPNECYIASGNTSNPSTGFAGLSFGAVTTPVYAGTVVNAGPYYIYENLAGTSSASNAPELRTTTNAPAGSSYLLITAKGTGYYAGWTSTYRVYLGGVTNAASPVVDYTNFNINRDFNYQCNIAISGSGANDVRVTYSPTTSTRTNVYFGDATVGNYLYSDGTTGTTTSGKTIVGIVFSNQLSSAEYNAGYKHGYALALTDASVNGPTWGPYASDAGLTKANTFVGYYNDIISGYYGTFTRGYNKSNGSYPAWQIANSYIAKDKSNNNVALPAGTSGWYLPSVGQWWDICANLGKVDLSSQQSSSSATGYVYSGSTATTNVNKAITDAGGTALTPSYYYWSASEYSIYNAPIVIFNLSNVYFETNHKNDMGCYVRAVLAF
ncbi:DUF4906 domain-containing protein [Segatella paludivivens]|uniref:DUF4906 domain-containing protein n=1 Tax=Segatella paludivivens TaxID=185294 RepID=UPI000360912C|nr:hypothetical protein [Segatella paludivivens]